MYPILFEVFGRPVGTYGIFMLLGAVAAWFLVKLLDKTKNKDVPLVFLMCICGGFIGAFLLRPITKIPELIINWEYFQQMPYEAVITFLFGEIVFYGGLIGGVIAMLLFCRKYSIRVLPMVDLFAPALAVAHGFGRLGCFFGGCCYGIQVHPSHPFAAIYPPISTITPAGIPLLATQLIEATSLFVIAVILVFVYKKTAGTGLAVCTYGILYSILRFTLEFYRGDAARGVYGWFSTSQYISMVLFAASIVFLMLIMRTVRGLTSQARHDTNPKP